MRDIRAQISQRHGIELSTQQIQELAARRLEAVLDPRTVKPALLDQLRRSAGLPVDAPPTAAEPVPAFDGTMLYASTNPLVRFLRRLLNPLLKLLFDPAPLIQALNDHTREQREAVRREAERDRRQAEWNALHFTILQRLVTEVSRASIDTQSLAMRVESLAAKVDFNERRVRGMETSSPQSAPAPAPRIAERAESSVAQTPPSPAAESQASVAPSEGARRRRRRRRGRRGVGIPPGEAGAVAAATGAAALDAAQSADDLLDDDLEGPELIEDEAPIAAESIAAPAPEEEPGFGGSTPLDAAGGAESDSQRAEQDQPYVTPHEPSISHEASTPQPSPAPDEPFPQQPGDPVEPGPTDR
jgi:hypothetical protein